MAILRDGKCSTGTRSDTVARRINAAGSEAGPRASSAPDHIHLLLDRSVASSLDHENGEASHHDGDQAHDQDVGPLRWARHTPVAALAKPRGARIAQCPSVPAHEHATDATRAGERHTRPK